MLKKYSFLTLILLFCISCSYRTVNPLEYKGDIITFGDGGGFSGIENGTVLLDNGQLFTLENRGTSYTFVRRIQKTETEQLFTCYETLGIEDLTVNTPGNTYQYIEFKKGEFKKRLVWSSNNTNKELQILYSILQSKAP